MPIFKSTYNILVKPWEDEVFNPNWFDSDKPIYPPSPLWDNSRELTIEDVDIWEVIYEGGGGTGVYASWCPYAEFYMLRLTGYIETFYGPRAQEELRKRLDFHKIPYPINKKWVDSNDMPLYKTQ